MSHHQAALLRFVDMPLASPITIPHCIRSAAAPVTNGVAYDVPVTLVYTTPCLVSLLILISTPGARISGFIPAVSTSVKALPLPENAAYAPVYEL